MMKFQIPLLGWLFRPINGPLEFAWFMLTPLSYEMYILLNVDFFSSNSSLKKVFLHSFGIIINQNLPPKLGLTLLRQISLTEKSLIVVYTFMLDITLSNNACLYLQWSHWIFILFWEFICLQWSYNLLGVQLVGSRLDWLS